MAHPARRRSVASAAALAAALVVSTPPAGAAVDYPYLSYDQPRAPNEFFGGGGTNNLETTRVAEPRAGPAGGALRVEYDLDPGEFGFFFESLWSDQALARNYLDLDDFYRDLAQPEVDLDRLDLWVRGSGATGNQHSVKVELKDEADRTVHRYIQIADSSTTWTELSLPLDLTDGWMGATATIERKRLKQLAFVVERAQNTHGTGSFFLDDVTFVDEDASPLAAGASDDALLERISLRAFQYFLDWYDPSTGLWQDRSNDASRFSVAATGFGLSALATGASRGWVDGDLAADRVRHTLQKLRDGQQPGSTAAESTDQNGYRGFFYHFLDADGQRAPGSELSPVDTALLLMGVLHVREHFAADPEIVALADELYGRVQWTWIRSAAPPMLSRAAWSPECGGAYTVPADGGCFSTGSWDYATDEVILIDLLAIGSPTHPVPADAFFAWQRELDAYGGHALVRTFFGSLFTYFFAHQWIDFGLLGADAHPDPALRVDWRQNAAAAARANRQFVIDQAAANPGRFPAYGPSSWGLTASETPGTLCNGLTYCDYGALPAASTPTHDGTIQPYGAAGTAMLVPDVSVPALRHYYEATDLWRERFGLADSYNLDPEAGIGFGGHAPWYNRVLRGIDEGPLLLGIDAHRGGAARAEIMRSPYIRSALCELFAASDYCDEGPLIGDAAYGLVSERSLAGRERFLVYENADSGFNHGFASGFFPEAHADKIHVDAACVDDPAAAGGCTTDPDRLDRTRGTVLSVAFDPLPSGAFAGVNVEEPPGGVGYDLRGAERLVFEARSPTAGGVWVRFGLDGEASPFMHIPEGDSYGTHSIEFDSLGLTPSELSDVRVLFTVVTDHSHAPGGGVVLLDDIRVEPVPTAQQSALGLPLSTQTFGVKPLETPASGREPFPPDQTNRNTAATYEASLALMALLDRGNQTDLTAAGAIADALAYALDHDNDGLALPVASDGSTGLHSAYKSGDLPLRNDQGGGGQAGQVAFAGFSASHCGYCLVLDGATGGNNAFAVLALLAAYERLGQVRYLDAARTIARWIDDRLADRSGSGFGGYFLGYPDGGQPKEELIRSKSTENNVDIFSAFMRLAEIEGRLGHDADAQLWTERANAAGDFAIAMFRDSDGCFNAGTDPAGPDEVTNTADFFDPNSFSVLALAESERYRDSIDWRRPVDCILGRFAESVTAAGRSYRGFNIVPEPTAGPNGVAWEFTGQAVTTLRLVDRLYDESSRADEAALYLHELRQAQVFAPFADGRGLVAATMQGGDALPPGEQCLSTPFQCIPERVGMAATTWAIFAERDFNPLSITADFLPPPAPSITDTDPDSPANDNNPEAKGTAEPGSTVEVFKSDDCSGAVAAQGSAASFASPGLTVGVDADATTQLTATATDAAGNVSACSSTASYTEDSTPPDAPTITDTDPDLPANDNDPEVKGTAEPGSTVRLYRNGSCSGAPDATGTAAAFGASGITLAVPDDTTTTVSAQALDPAGNVSPCSSSATYTEDSTPPDPPTITDLDSPANDNNPEVEGTAENGSTVNLYTTSDCSGPAAATGSAADFASGGLTVTVADDSTTTFRATATDAADNTSGCSTDSITYVEDSTNPAKPSITDTDPDSPANDDDPEVEGSAEDGSTVEIFKNGDCSGSPAASGSAATFASPGITVNVTGDAATTLTAQATDAAGNESPCSDPFAYVEDSTAPDAPTITDIDPDSPANDATPLVKGTTDGGSPVSVKVYETSDCTGGSTTGTLAAFTGAGIEVTVAEDAGTPLSARTVDAAGNESNCSNSITYVEDSTGPALPTLDDTDPDSLANDNDPEIEGTAENGSTVNLYTTSDCTGPPAATGSAASFASPGLTGSVADDSSTTYRATATDAAGNTSDCSTDSITYVEDSTDPAKPSITDTDSDSPANDNDPEVKGTAESGSTVQIFKTGDCSGSPAASGSAAAFASPGITVNVRDDAFTTLTAKAVDAADNDSVCSDPFTYREDTTLPAAPSVTDTDPDSPANDNNPEVKGTAPANSQISIYTTNDCSGTAAATGTSTQFEGAGITVNVPDDSTTTFRAKATSGAGDSACSSTSITYVEDSTDPAPPTLDDTDPDSPANDNNPEAKGTAEPGSTVEVFKSDDCSGAVAAQGSAASFASPGLTVGVDADATTQLTATATDAAGNVSPCSSTASYTEDSTPPVAPTITDTDPDSPANDNSLEVQGTAEAGSTVKLYEGGTCSGSPDATGSVATFTGSGITVTVSDDSTTTLSARATDAAGNESACSDPFTYTEDSTAPDKPSITITDPDSPANDNSPEVKGTAEAGSTVKLYESSSCTGAVEAEGTAAAFASPGLIASVANDQTSQFTATATDAAGNTSSCSSALSYTEDSTPPDAPSITDTDPDSPANDNSPRVKGTAEPGSNVRLYTSSDCIGSVAALGSAADFASPGLAVAVAKGFSATFRATATDAAGNVSACSASSVTYEPDADGDGTPDVRDCDDDNPGIHPGATDVPGNAIDEDCTGSDLAIVGTNGPDVLTGTPGADMICGLLGNDEMSGLGGDDTLFGGACNAKAKTIFGSGAGSDGNDKLVGGDGNDVLYGAGGNDKLEGGSGNDALDGGGGNDVLRGVGGKDTLAGGGGNDRLVGGAHVNRYTAGAGNDSVNAKNRKRETVDCGKGRRDRATVDRRDRVKGCERVKRARR